MKNIFKTLLLSFTLASTTLLSAQTPMDHGFATIRSTDAENYVDFLADDLLEGRDAGMRGSKLAAKYIISLLREWNIQPFLTTGYRQPFDVAKVSYPYKGKWEVHPDSLTKIAAKGAYHLRHLNNILATIPGKHANEYVVIGAHYDHEGLVEDMANDGIYNGADDNASGVSAVLQIAKAFMQSNEQPERTLIFAFWDGEEKGLLGSHHFMNKWEHPKQIKGYMNFDMVGRGPIDNPKHLTYFYTASHPAFGVWLKMDMEKYHFGFEPNYKAWKNPIGGSDNTFFAQAGIPIVWYHTEGHPDYTRPSDHADKIDYAKLTDITRAAFLCAWRMANEMLY